MREINSKSELTEILNGNTPILLDFYADWCGPCQTQLPIVDSLAEKHKEDFVIAKINIDKNQELAHEFQVRSIPALYFIKDKQVKEKLIGLQTSQVLDTKIHQYV
jgi:thioredoxin